MAFLALFVFEGCIGCIPGFLVVVFVLNKMEYDVFDAVHGFGIKEIKGIMWGRKMAVHTVCDKSLGIVHMGRGFPGIIGELNFMTHRAESGGGGANHRVVCDAENRKGNQNPERNENKPDDIFFHGPPPVNRDF